MRKIKIVQQVVPPRLHVLLAKDSSQAIVICRHKSNRTAIIGWDRKTDVFEVSQWLKGKLYPYRSDISFNGKYWLYFAMSEKNRTYTVLAKAPYLKGLDFYPKGDAWNGGGLFFSNKGYWLNDEGAAFHTRDRYASGLQVENTWNNEENYWGECPFIYFRRLERDNWLDNGCQEVDERSRFYIFSKRINDHWDLVKNFHVQSNHPVGRGIYYESYKLCNKKTNAEMVFANWEWADIDKGRILWAQEGKIMSGKVTSKGLEKELELFDTNPLQFTLLQAPY